ncbi:MAG: hypothetical protein RBJ76_28405 [Stenomitos frigidus ULC029]
MAVGMIRGFEASDVNFLRMANVRQSGLLDVGVIKLKAGANVQAVLAELRSRLPNDVKVMTREDYAKAEVAFWNASTPVGYTFDLGVVIAFIASATIVYQILYSDVTDHLPEYATLKAMGFRDRYTPKESKGLSLIPSTRLICRQAAVYRSQKGF